MTDSPDITPTDTSKAARRPVRGPSRMIAVLAATVVAAGGVAYVASRAGNTTGPLPKLALTARGGTRGAAVSQDSSARSSLALNVTYRYVLDRTLPDLASRAPVSRLVWPRVDAETVRSWAKTLGVDSAEPVDEGRARGWTVTAKNGMLNVGENASMAYFNYQSGGGSSAGGSSPGTKPEPGASTGSGTASDVGSTTSPESGTDPGTVVPFAPITSDGQPSRANEPVGEPAAPEDLPSAADARVRAEHVLRGLGVLDGDWEFEATEGGSTSVSGSAICVPDTPCAPPAPKTVVMSRMIVAHRVIDGRRVGGLEWTVDIGDHAAITSVSGTLAKAEVIGDYPLRSTSSAIDELRNGRGPGVPIPLGAPEARSTVGMTECGPAVDCVTPGPVCIDTCPAREVTITITDVALGSQLWFGSEATAPTAYLVPMYHFTGHDDTGAAWSADVLAVEDGQLATPDAPQPVLSPAPDPAVAPPTPAAPPAAAPGIEPGTNPGTKPRP